MTLLAIVRVRGMVDTRKTVNRTLEILGLTENNHCVVVKETPIVNGMIKKAINYITYGVPSKEILKQLILKRGRLLGNKRITDEWLKANKVTLDSIAEMFEKDSKKIKELGIKKVFRLNPPSKGFERKGVKQPFAQGGALGDRKDKIDNLLKRMI